MSHIEGDFYDGRESRRQPAQLHVLGDRLSIRQDGRELKAPVGLAEVDVSARLGNTPRYLAFADGSKFETLDNEGVDALLRHHGRDRHYGLLHSLETRKRYILFALVFVAAFTAWGILFGIPMAAKVAARALPQESNAWIAKGVLEILDKQYLEPSELDEPTRQRLLGHFERLTSAYEGELELNILFRQGAVMGANAIALPSGTIIFTDELVRLAEHDDQLSAVLAHEIGHVVGRHGLRRAIQSSALGVLMVTVFGDVSTLSSIVAALPVVLTEMGYSRAFEREADRFAYEMMQQQGIALGHFASILTKLERYAACRRADAEEGAGQAGCEPPEEGKEERSKVFDYLSTHPPTRERVRPFLGEDVDKT